VGKQIILIIIIIYRLSLQTAFYANCELTLQDCVMWNREQIIDECSCVSSQLSFTSIQLQAVNYNVCGNLTSPVDGSLPGNTDHDLSGFRSLSCLKDVHLDWDSCEEQCDWPCFEYAYDATSTQSNDWPHVGYHIAFYDERIKDKPYADKFAVYGAISEALAKKEISEVGFASICCQ